MEYTKKSLTTLFVARSKLRDKGFTLLELVIVVLVLGVLTTIGLPSLISQVGKAREAEARQNLSAIAFAQQAYHFENRTFADTYAKMGITFTSTNYDYAPPTSSNLMTISDAVPKNLGNDSYRTYSMGIYYNDGSFSIILCQAANPTTITQAPNNRTGSCSDGGIIIQ